MNKKMPFGAWLLFGMLIFACGIWTYLTPTDTSQIVEHRSFAVTLLSTPIPWIILAIIVFVSIFPPKFGRR